MLIKVLVIKGSPCSHVLGHSDRPCNHWAIQLSDVINYHDLTERSRIVHRNDLTDVEAIKLILEHGLGGIGHILDLKAPRKY